MRFLFSIKSASHSAEHLDSRVETFANCAATYLYTLSDAEFQSRVEELAKDILEPPSSLDEAADELWGGVTRRDFIFDGSSELQANAVRGVSKDDVVRWWDAHVMSETRSRTKLAVWIEASVPAKKDSGKKKAGKVDGSKSPSSSSSSSDDDDDDDSDDEEKDSPANSGNDGKSVEPSTPFPCDAPFRAIGWAEAICPVVDVAPGDLEAFKATLPLFACP